MSVKIINKEELEEIPFSAYSSNESISPFVNFVFEVNVSVGNNTSILLSLERNLDVFFINRNDKLTRQLNFYPSVTENNIFHRRIKFYTHLQISEIDNMPFMLFLKLPTPSTTWQDSTTSYIKTI
ncbi:hypothetical protein [Aquimarina spinulae]|uniref:hypothetical protein n=1 Tax=Aquimarina spinulae TaxID=1192023 RepID=UPI000D55D4EA|nr:hypothetical protein [Aquimarina spinulae]